MNEIKNVDFFKGGKALFTVSNNKSQHYTYYIRKKEFKPTKNFQNPSKTFYFVNLLTGPQNTSDYTYLGMYYPESNIVSLTKKSKYTEDSLPVRVIRWAIKKVTQKAKLPDGYAIQHEGRCCRCKRVLTTPESIKLGIGPECIKMIK